MNKLLFIALIMSLMACNSDSSESTEDQIVSTKKAATSNNDLENKRALIDAHEDKYSIANSLSFRHNDGSLEEAFAFLDDNNQIKKIEERYTNGKTGNSGKRIYYLENGKKFLTIERFSDNKNAKGAYRERISYYDKNAQVISTKERLAQFEEELLKVEFADVAKYDCSMERADEVLNNKGVFATTFQGFVNGGNLTYLLVGGPGETGYASALAIQYEDKQIQKLKNNEVAFINTPLSVQFEKMLDERDLEFQVLLSMKILGK
jgi:hypothetical protein